MICSTAPTTPYYPRAHTLVRADFLADRNSWFTLLCFRTNRRFISRSGQSRIPGWTESPWDRRGETRSRDAPDAPHSFASRRRCPAGRSSGARERNLFRSLMRRAQCRKSNGQASSRKTVGRQRNLPVSVLGAGHQIFKEYGPKQLNLFVRSQRLYCGQAPSWLQTF